MTVTKEVQRVSGGEEEYGHLEEYRTDPIGLMTRIRELASEHVNLVETLAERVARMVLDEFGAAWVKVSIAKLGILKDVGLVGVSVERKA